MTIKYRTLKAGDVRPEGYHWRVQPYWFKGCDVGTVITDFDATSNQYRVLVKPSKPVNKPKGGKRE